MYNETIVVQIEIHNIFQQKFKKFPPPPHKFVNFLKLLQKNAAKI